MNLEQFGWSEFFAQRFAPYQAAGYEVGRVAQEQRSAYVLYTAHGEQMAELSGKQRHQTTQATDLPTVGDWVVIESRVAEQRATIHQVLPRRSTFLRQAAGMATQAQLVAANVDTVFLVSGLDHDFNLRRLERYLLLTWESGAIPVVVLNKADLCDRPDAYVAEVEAIAPSVPVVLLSALHAQGLAALHPYLHTGQTVALLGSSGVGKSTLANGLLGTATQATQAVRTSDSRGRHTTTTRSLLVLPSGGLLLDTPGMRELQLWASEESLHQTFEDIEALAMQCRFRDCRHQQEPDCAVQAAIASGTLEAQRLVSYLKLHKELTYLAQRHDQQAQQREKQRWKQIHIDIKRHYKHKGY